MAQNVSGFRAIFSNASMYNLAQRLVGAEKARRILVRNYFPASNAYRMLDIGCGTAEILRHLPEGIDYFGFDASQTYIDQAKEQFGDRGTFRAELVRQASLSDLEGFDIVLAFGLLHHLDNDEAEALFKLGKQVLKKDGKLITIDPVYSEDQHMMARWIISKDRGQSVRNAESYTTLAQSQFDDVTTTIRHDMLHIPYSHCILECKNSDV